MKGDTRKQGNKAKKKETIFYKKIIALKKMENIIGIKYTKDEKHRFIYQMSTKDFYGYLQQTKQKIGYGA